MAGNGWMMVICGIVIYLFLQLYYERREKTRRYWLIYKFVCGIVGTGLVFMFIGISGVLFHNIL